MPAADVGPLTRPQPELHASGDEPVFEKLRRIHTFRRVFEDLASRLIGDVVGSVMPHGRLLEIGAGDGQLHDLLAPSVRARLVCTEPRALGLQTLRARGIEAVRGSAENLPVPDASCAGVMGLCVLDVVQNPRAAVLELYRVLRPGACVVHWLDMTTELAPALSELRASGLIALPNVFTNPGDTTWPEDLFLIEDAQLDLVASILERERRPAGAVLRHYQAAHAAPFRPGRATAAFNSLNDDPELHPRVRHAFATAFERGRPEERARLRGFQGRPVSSARYFASRLQRLFCDRFQIVHNGILSVGGVRPRGPSDPLYTSLVTGSLRTSSVFPQTRRDASAPKPSPQQRLVELGVHTFIARRTR